MQDEGYYSEAAATFGDRLAGAREAAGLSQTALATRIGVETATLQAWEDDMDEPRANRLQMLAGMLNVSLSWLLTGRGDGPEAPAEGTPPALGEILSEMRVLRAEMLQAAERMATLEKRLKRTAEAAS
ncbi:transcriptional regulator with XRE-family HTH domain [Limimaricola variabilis]|uniref:Transcriptional regulator with XRE-family HTH domain n=1 Tax=Limimaricola variabilis TaxID=1492771 RepID=A0ABR6HNX9_9RHOB|nr:helix-turn-helix transcriptional regulator [Limimaricola variabilis]MBB3712163.1 transcriptional regulator with XRE-family HTH domain [Limimaricola variabilis]WPY95992.1 helix-turn-helix transcriptional regulator [Limimaricola variabilis]